MYMTFGTVLGHMADAPRVYRTALKAVEHLDADQDGGSRALISDQESPSVAAAIESVLGDPAYRRSVGVIAAEMAAMPTVEAILGQLPSPR